MPARTTLLAAAGCALVLAGCGGSSAVDVTTGASAGSVPAQGPCDEPLLDGDVVAGRTASVHVGAGATVVAAGMVLADGPLYDSVESLADAADLVVRGTVGPVVAEAGDGFLPAPVRTVEVAEVLAGDAPDDLRVAFTLGDTAGERCAPVVEGREVVLFLHRTEPDAADVDADLATHLVVGSHNNGVLTVDGDVVLTHSWVPDRLRDGDPGRDDLPPDGGFPPPGLELDLDEVRDVVTSRG